MYVLTVCSVNVTNRVDPIEVFKLACTGRVISSRRSMVYMSKFILIYGLLELFSICLLALEAILFFNRIYRNYFVNNFVRKASTINYHSAKFMLFSVYQESSSPYQRPRHSQAKTEIYLIIRKKLCKPVFSSKNTFRQTVC
jgi:hypothetical protein